MDEVLENNKLAEGFVKYSNDLFFHHLLLNNEDIRNMFCQQLIFDRKIISTKVKNEKQHGRNYREKKLILDLLAEDEQGVLYNVEMQAYDMTIDIIIRTQMYGAEILRRQIEMGNSYDGAGDVRQLIINVAKPLEGCHYYRHDFVMYDKEHDVEFPNNKLYVTIIQLKYIEQVMDKMSAFDQMMYLFKNNRVYDKIETDRLVKEAVEMHKEYISSEENYQEYWDRRDNQLLMNSKIRLAKMYEEKAEKLNAENEKYSKKVEKLSVENEKLHEEKVLYNQRTRNNINHYIQKEFQKDISQWLQSLDEEQLFIIQDYLYMVNSVDELKKLI